MSQLATTTATKSPNVVFYSIQKKKKKKHRWQTKQRCLCSVRVRRAGSTYRVGTYKSVFVWDVVGQLQLVERHHLLHPLLPGGWRVRVDVQPLRHLGVRLARHHPLAVVELVATVVHGDDVHQEDVFGLLVQPRYFDLERWEHPSANRNRTSYRGTETTKYSTDERWLGNRQIHKKTNRQET